MNQAFRFFMKDYHQLLSLKESILSIQNTRKLHFDVSLEIQKLNKEAETISFVQAGGKLSAGKKLKNLITKIGGKKVLTEQEIYTSIKLKEKRLKCIDQLLSYQTVFISQVLIPNFNINRQKMADDFVKGAMCQNQIKMLKKEDEMWQ